MNPDPCHMWRWCATCGAPILVQASLCAGQRGWAAWGIGRALTHVSPTCRCLRAAPSARPTFRWHPHPQAMDLALRLHHHTIRALLQRHQGHESATEGVSKRAAARAVVYTRCDHVCTYARACTVRRAGAAWVGVLSSSAAHDLLVPWPSPALPPAPAPAPAPAPPSLAARMWPLQDSFILSFHTPKDAAAFALSAQVLMVGSARVWGPGFACVWQPRHV